MRQGSLRLGHEPKKAIPNVANKLKSPLKTDKRLGPNKDTWCEFHQTFGHSLRNCLTLGFQLDKLVRNGFLKEYLQELQGAPTSAALVGDQGQEVMEEGQAQPHIKRQEPRHAHPKPNQERLGQRKERLGQSEERLAQGGERLKGEHLEGRVERLGPITKSMTKLRM